MCGHGPEEHADIKINGRRYCRGKGCVCMIYRSVSEHQEIYTEGFKAVNEALKKAKESK